MQKLVIKAGKTERFYIAVASINKESDGKYKAILTLCDSHKNGKYVVSDISISGKNKQIVLSQVMEVAKEFPPVNDITILDMEVLRKYE